MKRNILLTLCLLCCFVYQTNAQNWPKSFSGIYAKCLVESYDNGYYITGPKSNYKLSWILKTDINGSLIWSKIIGSNQYICIVSSIEPTEDGGFIISGGMQKYDPTSGMDPFLIKLNSCGSIEWCKVINTSYSYDWAIYAKTTTQNEILVLTINSAPNPNYHTQLFKFSNSGDLIWRQNYPNEGMSFEDTPSNLLIENDSYLITGSCYYPEPGIPGGYERPYFIKTDTAGNIIWRLVYGSSNGFHGITFYSTIASNSNKYYSMTTHSNTCDTPALVKFSFEGTEDYYQDIMPGACPGGAGAINWLNDSTFIIKVIGIINNSEILKWIQIDTLGVEKQAQIYSELWMRYSGHAIMTSDNKIASLSSNGGQTIYFYKLNSNLEFDSIYTMPHVYDSLCPYPIVSDTIDPDCGLIVNIEEPDKIPEMFNLIIYPNPAKDLMTVKIPRYLQKQSGPAGFQVTTVYHQWGTAILKVYDLKGMKKME